MCTAFKTATQTHVPRPMLYPTTGTRYDKGVTAIRVIFDGKSFVPQQPVSLPAQSEALVIAAQDDPSARAQLDASVRAYYEGVHGNSDAEDDAWGKAVSPLSHRAWDED